MKQFKKTYIEITNVCNLSCSFCPKTTRSTQFMSRELFQTILREIQGYAKFLYFHVMGEPLLHPEIETFLDISEDYGLKVNITTNGTLIDQSGSSIVGKPALRQVNFSLHSFEANVRKSTIDDYLGKIFSFIEQTRKYNLLICLRLWNLGDGNKNESNLYILDRIQKEFSLPYRIEEQLTPCKGIKIGDHIFLNQASAFEWPNINRTSFGSEKGFCYALRDQIAFLVDGTVVPCCLDGEGAMNLGNIQRQSFTEIIEGPRAKSIYEGFSQRKVIEDLCRRCGYRQRFNLSDS